MTAYIDRCYYDSVFGGEPMEQDEFSRLVRTSCELIDAIANMPITAVTENIKRAVCYEVELLHMQGGTEAYSGLAAATPGMVEQLGDYRISSSPYSASSSKACSYLGLPVSPVTVALLRADGLICRTPPPLEGELI